MENILRVGDVKAKATGTQNPMANFIAEAEGLTKIEALQQHENNDIYEKSIKILETYFGVEEEDEAIAPAQAAGGQAYAFGAQQSAPAGGFQFGQ